MKIPRHSAEVLGIHSPSRKLSVDIFMASRSLLVAQKSMSKSKKGSQITKHMQTPPLLSGWRDIYIKNVIFVITMMHVEIVVFTLILG